MIYYKWIKYIFKYLYIDKIFHFWILLLNLVITILSIWKWCTHTHIHCSQKCLNSKNVKVSSAQQACFYFIQSTAKTVRFWNIFTIYNNFSIWICNSLLWFQSWIFSIITPVFINIFYHNKASLLNKNINFYNFFPILFIFFEWYIKYNVTKLFISDKCWSLDLSICQRIQICFNILIIIQMKYLLNRKSSY